MTPQTPDKTQDNPCLILLSEKYLFDQRGVTYPTTQKLFSYTQSITNITPLVTPLLTQHTNHHTNPDTCNQSQNILTLPRPPHQQSITLSSQTLQPTINIIFNSYSTPTTRKSINCPYTTPYDTNTTNHYPLQTRPTTVKDTPPKKTPEDHGLISDEQYGGRKNRMSLSVVLNKICYYNISHQTLQSYAFMDDDARACYNRIVTSLSGLECQKWGLSKNVTAFTNQFIETQNYHIRSAYRLSKDHYSFTPNSPTQGSGQGVSWAGP